MAFAYPGFRRRAIDISNEVGLLPCIVFISFLWWYPADFIPSTILRISIPFDSFLDISILAWNSYLVRSMVFRKYLFGPLHSQCSATLMKLDLPGTWSRTVFLVSISSDKVHHTFMILSFRMWVMITSTMIAYPEKKPSPSGDMYIVASTFLQPEVPATTQCLVHSAQINRNFPLEWSLWQPKYTKILS